MSRRRAVALLKPSAGGADLSKGRRRRREVGMLVHRRVRTVAVVGALAVAIGLFTGPADRPAEAAPRTFTIVGAAGATASA